MFQYQDLFGLSLLEISVIFKHLDVVGENLFYLL